MPAYTESEIEVKTRWSGDWFATADRVEITGSARTFFYEQHGRQKISRVPLVPCQLRTNQCVEAGWIEAPDAAATAATAEKELAV